jgi:hypothetical protein
MHIVRTPDFLNNILSLVQTLTKQLAEEKEGQKGSEIKKSISPNIWHQIQP